MDNRFLAQNYAFIARILAHELGHALGLLEDECVAHQLDTSPDDERTPLRLAELMQKGMIGVKNCASKDEAKMRFPPPLNQIVPYDRRNSCTWEGIYRSTENSLMNYAFTEGRSNTISCAYIIRRFLGGKPSDYFDACNSNAYDTVKN